MKFSNKTVLNRSLVFLGLLFLSAYFPVKALALSADPAQHFDTSCAGSYSISSSAGTGWTIGSNGGATTVYAIQDATGDGISDSNDCSSNLLGLINCTTSNPTIANAVTITYTDPTPSAATTFIKLDINDQFGNRSFQMAVSATNGDYATITSNDVMQNCYTGTPSLSGNTAVGWNTLFIQLLGSSNPNFSNIAAGDLIKTVQITFTSDTNMDLAGNPIFIDNLRGDFQLSCNAPTNTATETATSTATSTATNTPTGTVIVNTATNTATYTATNTPTFTRTSTCTNTPTNTATGVTATFTNTATNTATKTPTSTTLATSTNTATSTVTVTPTVTVTVTPTNTATVTTTYTPAPCQIEVYPNPMDFTSSSSILNCPTGKCIIFSCLPLNATVKIYTVSLALVRTFPQNSVIPGSNLPPNVGYIAWDGTNGNATPVASGLYFYVVNAPGVNTFGKFAISKSKYGP